MTAYKVYLATMCAPDGRVWLRVGCAPGLGRIALAMIRHLPYSLTKVQCVEIHSKPLARKMVKDLAKTLPRSTSLNGWYEISDENDLAGIGPVSETYTGDPWPWKELTVRR